MCLNLSLWPVACGLAMARRSSLEDRLLAVLSQKRNRRTVTGLIVVSSLLTGAAAIPLAMLRAAEPIAQVDEKDDSAGKQALICFRT